MITPKPAIRLLLRRPGALQSPTAHWTVMTLAGTGAAFLVWSAVIHLQLWAGGYKDISVIGPLFLIQATASIILAVAILAVRRLILLAAGAAAGLATAAGLLLSAYDGLFGYTESLAVPYAALSLAVEFTAAFTLLTATGLLALATPARTTPTFAPVPSRT
jgi:hypothetical protein